MADVKIRRLDDWVVEAYKQRAKSAGHSLEEELRRIVTQAALKPRQEIVRRIHEFRESIAERHGLLSDSTVGIREDRDSRG